MNRGKLKIELSEMIVWWIVVIIVVAIWLSFEIRANGIKFIDEFVAYQIRLFKTEADATVSGRRRRYQNGRRRWFCSRIGGPRRPGGRPRRRANNVASRRSPRAIASVRPGSACSSARDGCSPKAATRPRQGLVDQGDVVGLDGGSDIGLIHFLEKNVVR